MAGPSEPFNENLKLHYQYAQTPFSLSLVQKSSDLRRARLPSTASDVLPSPTRRPSNPEQVEHSLAKLHHDAISPELRRRESLSRAQFLASLHNPAQHTYPTGHDPALSRRHASLQLQPATIPPHIPASSSQPTIGLSWPGNGPNIPPKPIRIPSSIQTKLNKETKEPSSRAFTPPTPPIPPPTPSPPLPTEIRQPRASIPIQPRPMCEDKAEEIVRLEKQLGDVTRQAASAEANANSLQNQLNQLQRDHKIIISSRARLEEEKRNISNTLSSTRRQLESARESVRAIQTKQLEENKKLHEAKHLQEQWERERDQVIWERNDANSRAQRATTERDTAQGHFQQLTEERDALRRAKEKASAERSAAISKKIELQARVASYERGGRIVDCPQIDALVKDRDEAKQLRDAAVTELEESKKQYAALELERGRWLQDVWSLREELKKANQEIKRLKQETAQRVQETKVMSEPIQEPRHENMEESLQQVTTPLSPIRKRVFEEESPLHPASPDQQSRKRLCHRDTPILV